MKTLLTEDTALDIINDLFNHVDSGDYGKVSLNQFTELIEVILPQAMHSTEHLQRIFGAFTGLNLDNNTKADPG